MNWVALFLRMTRASWLPGVWSNCLAGWWLGGGRTYQHLPFLLAGGTLLFLGGALLDDAFDAEHDRRNKSHRPIPAGWVSERTVWRWGLSALIGGVLLLGLISFAAAVGGLLLAGIIILHHGLHKLEATAPLLLGICRLGLYLIAALGAGSGITGWSIWCGLALMCYVAGSGFLLRTSRLAGLDRYWPLLLLAAPVLLGILMNPGTTRESALLLCAVLVLWTLRNLRLLLWSAPAKPLEAANGFLMGIVLVDWLALAHAPRELGYYFIGLAVATVVLSKLEHLPAKSTRKLTAAAPLSATPQTPAAAPQTSPDPAPGPGDSK